ncbi:MAG TPA: hypothetical protein VNK70_02455 [Candidatus Paceibacterota bacterium]|nr:hypothetical protein [Candidatus Paceibacterota bacterium]
MYPEQPKFEREITTGEQLEFIGSVFEKEAPVWLIGGYAEDALLYEGVSSGHGDVDLVALRDDEKRLEDYFRQKGFSVTPIVEAGSEKPLKFSLERGGVKVDVGFIDYDETKKQPYVDVEGREKRKFRVFLDKDMFKYNPTKLGDIEVKTVSPLSIIQVREAFY